MAESKKSLSNFYSLMYGRLLAWWTPQTKRLLLITFVATAAFTALAHGFLFANEFFSSDSITLMYYRGFAYYLRNGRFLIPLYEYWKGDAAAPWLIGALFLCWMTLASYVTIHLFDIQSVSRQILLCGLLCTNWSLTLTGATYVYCMDEYAFALLLSITASFFLLREGMRNFLMGLFLLVVSLSIYQVYFTVTLSLCFLSLFFRIIRGESLSSAFRAGVKCLVGMGMAFTLYYVLWRVFCALSGIAMIRVNETLFSARNANVKQLLWILARANAKFIRNVFLRGSVMGIFFPVVHILLLAVIFRWLFDVSWDRNLSLKNRRAALFLVCLLPTVFQSISIFCPYSDHDLTCYAEGLCYLFPVLIAEPAVRKSAGPVARLVLTALLCLALWYNVVFANQTYIKKDLEKNSTLVLTGQIIERIEHTEGYIPEKTPVVILEWNWQLDDNAYLIHHRETFDGLYRRKGLSRDYAWTYNMKDYLTKYLNYPILVDNETDVSQWEAVRKMPLFPEDGSVAMINGTLVIKISEIEDKT